MSVMSMSLLMWGGEGGELAIMEITYTHSTDDNTGPYILYLYICHKWRTSKRSISLMRNIESQRHSIYSQMRQASHVFIYIYVFLYIYIHKSGFKLV